MEYSVEKVLNRRINNGKVEYYLKWDGYSSIYNSWVREEHLNCAALIKAFQAKQAKEKHTKKSDGKNNRKRKHQCVGLEPVPAEKQKREEDATTADHENALQAEKILAATDRTGQLEFLIKWKDGSVSPMFAAQAKIQHPQIVIKFFESHLVFDRP